MKKIIASAVGLMLVGGVAVTNASAVESQFGGYWRTRMFVQDNFDQTVANDGDSNYSRTDTRTRLFYTAKFNDNLKFVNAFEFNASWGDANGGDIATDGDTFRVKHSYVDATFGMVRAKVGLQGLVISRGFIFDDDFAGAVVTGDFGAVKVPVAYISGPQHFVNGPSATLDKNGNLVLNPGVDNDTHVLSVMPSVAIGDNITLTPHATWMTTTSEDTDIYWLGVDADAKIGSVAINGTFIYNGGETADVEAGSTGTSDDISAFLVAGGVDAGIVHGNGFYASGDDTAGDGDQDDFKSISAYYVWSEIMGYGIFDNDSSPSTNADTGGGPSNIWALNVGTTLKPMDKLKLDFDVWYAQLAEEKLALNGQMEDELGLELDAKVTYALMDDLNAEFIFAYLIAGDATGPEDVMEGGVRLSLKF